MDHIIEQFKLLEVKEQLIKTTLNEMKTIESNLNGIEIHYQERFGTIDFVDGSNGTVNLYLEDENGNHEDRNINFEELFEVLKNSEVE